ncbi:ATP-binding protein [Streptomyces sp. B1I3]|uniref:ATP-binding protein n=1 Tax=Streptomyces sp. B1I3 TaxID=3042264 RepID=UPI002783DD13|nr:ATP-binding protein [Streptomyces sp. B1I3]MDQ0792173.1 anti-sigma regulatory factor (Ser/Thr protein kinase) [Streptomyces sp. B1I3]
MDLAGQDEGRQPLEGRTLSVSATFEGSEKIAVARDMACEFLMSLQAEHGLSVSQRAMDTVQLVVSELVTNARKYAPGACQLTLEVRGGAVEVTVWDSDMTLPSIPAPDPARIGQHGLEIVKAVCRSFEAHREPGGKRIRAAVVLADGPGDDAAGHQVM